MAFTHQFEDTAEGATLRLAGGLDAESIGPEWNAVLARAGRAKQLVVEAGEIERCDGAGTGLLFALKMAQRATGGEIAIVGLKPEFAQMLDRFRGEDFRGQPPERSTPPHLFSEIGRGVWKLYSSFRHSMAFRGEVNLGLLQAIARPRSIRWREQFKLMEKAGANSLPIITLVSFLIGLILAFQSAAQMQRYGAEIWVSSLIGFSMVREMGPLTAAIVLAGRTGSAYAAELGTMKINEEIDALTTMGISPARFLVVPRVIAVAVMMPFLAMYASVAGMIGGAVVIQIMGYPMITYYQQIFTSEYALGFSDIFTGLFKAIVFGYLIGRVGCQRGLSTGGGSTAVGDAATSAVVICLVLIAVWDGLFTVVFYTLGW